MTIDSRDNSDDPGTEGLNPEMKNIENQKLVKKVDTLFHNYVFSYKLIESEIVLKRRVINWLGEIEILHYPELFLEVDLWVDNTKVISRKKIEKFIFENFVSPEEIAKLLLFFGGISELSTEGIVLRLSLCVPDTSDCYLFDLEITIDGRIHISEKEIDWDFY